MILYEGWAITGKLVAIAPRLLDKIRGGPFFTTLYDIVWQMKGTAAWSRRALADIQPVGARPDKESNKCKLFVTFNNCIGPRGGWPRRQEKENTFHLSKQEPASATFEQMFHDFLERL